VSLSRRRVPALALLEGERYVGSGRVPVLVAAMGRRKGTGRDLCSFIRLLLLLRLESGNLSFPSHLALFPGASSFFLSANHNKPNWLRQGQGDDAKSHTQHFTSLGTERCRQECEWAVEEKLDDNVVFILR
jgi:hypothetical protein